MHQKNLFGLSERPQRSPSGRRPAGGPERTIEPDRRRAERWQRRGMLGLSTGIIHGRQTCVARVRSATSGKLVAQCDMVRMGSLVGKRPISAAAWQDGVADRIGRCMPVEHLAGSGIHQCAALVRIPHRLGIRFGRAARTQFDSGPQVYIQLRYANDCAAVPLPETVGSRHLRDRYTGMETGQSDVFAVWRAHFMLGPRVWRAAPRGQLSRRGPSLPHRGEGVEVRVNNGSLARRQSDIRWIPTSMRLPAM